VVCTDDRTVSPALQRAMAERATRVVELDTDHCPMNSRPDDVAALLIGLSAPAAG
jgi:pimeloyl-ACP methyl ester carboxylesterase